MPPKTPNVEAFTSFMQKLARQQHQTRDPGAMAILRQQRGPISYIGIGKEVTVRGTTFGLYLRSDTRENRHDLYVDFFSEEKAGKHELGPVHEDLGFFTAYHLDHRVGGHASLEDNAISAPDMVSPLGEWAVRLVAADCTRKAGKTADRQDYLLDQLTAKDMAPLHALIGRGSFHLYGRANAADNFLSNTVVRIPV